MAKLELEISNEEKAILEHEAYTHGLPLADYARQRLFDQSINEKPSDANGRAVILTSEDGYQFEFPDEENSVAASTTNGRKPIVDAKNTAAIAMLDQWLVEDATDDIELIRKATEEYEELKRNLNANRIAAGESLVFP